MKKNWIPVFGAENVIREGEVVLITGRDGYEVVPQVMHMLFLLERHCLFISGRSIKELFEFAKSINIPEDIEDNTTFVLILKPIDCLEWADRIEGIANIDKEVIIIFDDIPHLCPYPFNHPTKDLSIIVNAAKKHGVTLLFPESRKEIANYLKPLCDVVLEFVEDKKNPNNRIIHVYRDDAYPIRFTKN
jgi:hypothetical protein